MNKIKKLCLFILFMFPSLFVYGGREVNTLEFNLDNGLFEFKENSSSDVLWIKQSIFFSVLTPYHSLLSSFLKVEKDTDKEEERIRKGEQIQTVLKGVSFPENLLIPLAEFYSKASQGGKNSLYLFKDKKKKETCSSFGELINGIKNLWSEEFSREKLIKNKSLNFEIVIQKEPTPSFLVNQSNLDSQNKLAELSQFKSKEFARIAIFGMVLYDKKVLFLKQNDPRYNKNWRPPGGGLKANEDIIDGLKREILEDTSLEVDVVRPVTIWKGPHGIDGKVISLTYLCLPKNDEVVLSSEFSDHQWIPIEELQAVDLQTDFDLKDWRLLEVDDSFH